MKGQFGFSLQRRGVLAEPETITSLAERTERLGRDSLVPAILVVLEGFAPDIRLKVHEPP